MRAMTVRLTEILQGSECRSQENVVVIRIEDLFPW